MTPTDWPTTDLCRLRATTTPNRTALVDADDGRRWTYRELDDVVTTLAGRLDVETDARVGTLLSTGPRLVTTAFAVARLGGTLVLLPPDESNDSLVEKASQASLDGLVTATETDPLGESLASRCDVDRIVTLHDVPTAPGDGASRRDDPSDATGTATMDAAELGPDHTQVVVFTSGTTGTPKGVRVTTSNLRSSAVASAFRLGVDPDDRWLVPLPQHHMGGFAPVVRSALYGTTLVTTRSTEPHEIARIVEDIRCTGTSVVPTMVRSLLEWGWDPPSHLRFVLTGGAPTPSELVTACGDAGIPICPSYGASETASQIATATPDQARRRPDSVGHPLVGTSIELVGEDGTPVDQGETGEVIVSGPTVSPGYLDPAQTAAAFEDGRFRTGDLGHLDDGALYVTGRRSDRIVTGGETVDPTEVAHTLCEHRSVTDAAVVGLRDDRWGERVGAAIVLDSDAGDVDRAALERFCDDRFAPHKRPRTIAFVDTLPRTDSGTVDRNAVRTRLETDR
ncbi:class I adenylate-forming enzyme family protein [Halovivax cerinus]|uniref:Class I adenylate-forming enzyme family protein n=1 Tax=Halovivax cerinus TaxID=1487865 RepID=A0ABD5NSC3_9EURY|nr:class I adenylate-forming enzyme family protein [Halovivax cerinus]